MWKFEVDLADSDRGLYEPIELRVAQHPSETARFMVARVLARLFEHDEGVEFGRGVSTADEPAILQRNLRGETTAWIEVGLPSLDRLHKAKKTGARVVVWGWKGLDKLATEAVDVVYRASELRLVELDDEALDALADGLERVNRWQVSISGGVFYVDTGSTQIEVVARVIPVAAA